MRILIIFILLPVLNILAQDSTGQELDSILNLDQAEQFIKAHPNSGSEIITFNEENHQTKMVRDLFDRGHVTIESDTYNTYYKMVERLSIPHYRASYIYLDGTKMNAEEINTTRNQIISKYYNGISFSDLAKKYSMDDNANRGGDLGWFTEGTYNQDFEHAIINNNHQIDDIFTLDIDKNNWYYVILKTHDSKEIREVKALKMIKPKD